MPSPYASGASSEDALPHDDLSRTFRVHLPPGYDPDTPLPLVLMLHGGGGSGEQVEESSSNLSVVADEEGFIAVYPDGTGFIKTWNAGGCCGSAVTNDIDDVGFMKALLDELEATLCVDRRRVFATGMSNGGMMTHRLACELPERFAAFAPAAAAEMSHSCTPSVPRPLMHIHGSADAHVPVEGGLGCGPSGVPYPALDETMETRRLVNGCDPTTAVAFTAGDGTCSAYQGCDADVLLCLIDGGGHSWPGGEPPGGAVDCPADGPQSSTFDASREVWRFFADHPKPKP
jgi:polyhydroxybutyrate depolymerase